MTTAVQALSSVRALALFGLFDRVLALGSYAKLELLERTAPGSVAALSAWAEAHGFAVHQRSVTPPGLSPLTMTVVDCGPAGTAPRITVQWEAFS